MGTTLATPGLVYSCILCNVNYGHMELLLLVGSPQPPTYHNLVLAFIQILNLTQSVSPMQLSPDLTQLVSCYSHRSHSRLSGSRTHLRNRTHHVTTLTILVTGDRTHRDNGQPERETCQEAGSGLPLQ